MNLELNNTFKIKNYNWGKESWVSFNCVKDGCSYIISTNDDCIEIVSDKEPIISNKYNIVKGKDII